MNRAVFAIVAIIAIALVAVFGLFRGQPSSPAESGAGSGTPSATGGLCANQPVALTSLKDADVTELKLEDPVVGSGAEAVAGKTVSMQYIGRLVDGTKFDASCDRGGEPFVFPLGGGQVIQGWDQGIVGMKVGGIRRLIIPASLGYGARGAPGAIPPNAALIFDVELVAVQ